MLKTEDNDFYEKQKNHVCEMIYSIFVLRFWEYIFLGKMA
nr:MAG TPA: hypothetical protein [Caudoviricetes sp.]